jgi:hypothetical protein
MEIVKQQHIESKIVMLRDVQVILDKDLASFYEVKPIRLREQVKRNQIDSSRFCISINGKRG